MVKVEVFTSGLTDDSRVGFVEINVVCDVFPEGTEDVSRTSEVKSGEMRRVDALLDDFGRWSLCNAAR